MLTSLSMEIPALEENAEGQLKGGFGEFYSPGVDTFATNSNCDCNCGTKCDNNTNCNCNCGGANCSTNGDCNCVCATTTTKATTVKPRSEIIGSVGTMLF